MKKSFVLIFAVALVLAGCGKKAEPVKDAAEPSGSSVQAETPVEPSKDAPEESSADGASNQVEGDFDNQVEGDSDNQVEGDSDNQVEGDSDYLVEGDTDQLHQDTIDPNAIYGIWNEKEFNAGSGSELFQKMVKYALRKTREGLDEFWFKYGKYNHRIVVDDVERPMMESVPENITLEQGITADGLIEESAVFPLPDDGYIDLEHMTIVSDAKTAVLDYKPLLTCLGLPTNAFENGTDVTFEWKRDCGDITVHCTVDGDTVKYVDIRVHHFGKKKQPY